MKKRLKFLKNAHGAFHSRLIYFYCIVLLLLFCLISGKYFNIHFNYWNEFEKYKSSLYPENKIQSPPNEEQAKAIKDCADLLSQNMYLLIGIVTVLGIVLTLLFYAREHKKQNFIIQYSEYLKIYKENVLQIGIEDKRGDSAFIEIFKEVKFVYDNFPINTDVYKIYRLEWAYLFVFFGLGESATPIIRAYLSKKYPAYSHEINQVVQAFSDLKLKFHKSNKRKQIKVMWFTIIIDVNEVLNPELNWVLDGHQSALNRYYRHLYQMIAFVRDSPAIFSFEKYKYVENIIEQFSNEELALFLINSYSPLGKIWLEENLITDYQLIKHLPVNFLFPFGKEVKADFPVIDFKF